MIENNFFLEEIRTCDSLQSFIYRNTLIGYVAYSLDMLFPYSAIWLCFVLEPV